MRALEISEGLLAQTSSTEAREGLLTEMSSAYETAFDFAAASDDVSGGFSIMERVRGRITTEMLLQPAGSAVRKADMEVEDRIRNLKVDLIKASAPDKRDHLIDQLFYAEQERYVEDKPAPVYERGLQSVSLERVIDNVGSKAAILEYVLKQDGNAYCLFISQSGARIVRLGSAAKLTALAESLVTELKSNKPWRIDARKLYDEVLGPIPDINQYSQLTIVPDGVLHTVPFDVLLLPSGKLLGATAITAYAPSAVSEVLLKNRSGLTVKNAFLGVGGAIYSKAGAQPFRLANADVRGGYLGLDATKLPNLPGSREEVQSAADILRATGGQETLQVGSTATEFSFTHAPLQSFNVIHLAIHAVANTEDPSRAALIFPPDSQHGDDGLLQPQDIARLHLAAHIVVLSACDTAVGHLQGQVGVANIARAFLQAGADSVVSTLWPVDDIQSLTLMKAFYKHLASGDTVAAALTSAKRDVFESLGQEASPVTWAGFVLLGNGDASIRSSPMASLDKGLSIQ